MKLNLDYYKSDIIYNKLDSEDKIIEEYINNVSEKEYPEILKKNENIEVLYALSETRKNIISWYPFEKNKNILEIGAGLGEITGELCKNAEKVISIEFSKSRGEAIAKRHFDKDNLEVIIGNLKDIKFDKKFDYITLIGILEYAPIIFKTENSFKDLIDFCKNLLKENGKLLIATDNKFGMRNWSTTDIDEKNLRHNSISSSKNKNTCQIFSKSKLEKMIGENVKFYYPLPDYKFTNVIFTNDFLPDKNNIHRNMSFFYNDEILSFHENDGYLQIINENKEMFEFFANSYFIEFSNNLEDNNIKYVSYWNNRKPEYRLKTIIQGNKVYKYPTNDYAIKHIEQLKNNIDIMAKSGIKTLDSYDDNRIISNYVENFETYDKEIIKEYENNGIDGATKKINEFKEKIIDKLEDSDKENNVFEKFNIECDNDLIETMHFKKYGLWDLSFQNCFVIDDELYMYDQEWMIEKFPVEFIIYRNILIFNELNRNLDRNELYKILELDKYKNVFDELENKISSSIMYEHINKIWNRPVKNVRGLYLENNNNIGEVARKEEELKKIAKELNNIINSKLWKATKPIRYIVKKLK